MRKRDTRKGERQTREREERERGIRRKGENELISPHDGSKLAFFPSEISFIPYA